MKLAIMQPYLFPYIGYFQLAAAVDKFVFYDDVNFIKNGWINRNRMLLGDQVRYLTVPLSGASPSLKINEVLVQPRERWLRKLLESIRHAYAKAPHYPQVSALIGRILAEPLAPVSLLASHTVMEICRYLEIDTEFVPSSTKYGNAQLEGHTPNWPSNWREQQASTHRNCSGGRELYRQRRICWRHRARLHRTESVSLRAVRRRISPRLIDSRRPGCSIAKTASEICCPSRWQHDRGAQSADISNSNCRGPKRRSTTMRCVFSRHERRFSHCFGRCGRLSSGCPGTFATQFGDHRRPCARRLHVVELEADLHARAIAVVAAVLDRTAIGVRLGQDERSRHARAVSLAIAREGDRARVAGDAVPRAAEADDLEAARAELRHLDRRFVAFAAGVDEERPSERLRNDLRDRLGQLARRCAGSCRRRGAARVSQLCLIAATMFGWLWPTVAHIWPDVKSRIFLPAASQT